MTPAYRREQPAKSPQALAPSFSLSENPALPSPEADPIALRLAQWRETIQPQTSEDEWLLTQVVTQSIRIDQCQRDEAFLRPYYSHRAKSCWDADRTLEVESLAANLSKKPALIARKLESSPHGCEWLINQWRGLAYVLAKETEWDEKHKALAFDLLGTPPEFRLGEPNEDVDSPLTLVNEEIERLEGRKSSGLIELDEARRAAAIEGYEIEPPTPLLRLRRYESSCFQRMRWARKRINNRNVQDQSETPIDRTPQTPRAQPKPPEFVLPDVPEPTEDEYRQCERALFAKAFEKGFSPASGAPASLIRSPKPSAPPLAPLTLTPNPLPPNRQARRSRRRARR